MHASVDANCLAAQSGDIYWTYVDYLHSHGEEISGPDRDQTRSYAALDRIARQEGTVAKLDSGKLDACLAKQDETEVKSSVKEGRTSASTERRLCLSTANASPAPFPRSSSGWRSTAPCAPKANNLRLRPDLLPPLRRCRQDRPADRVSARHIHRIRRSRCYPKTGAWIYP